jgi:hypothetical protein
MDVVFQSILFYLALPHIEVSSRLDGIEMLSFRQINGAVIVN